MSNNKVRRRIDEIAQNVRERLINRIKNCIFFAIQLDESTGIVNNANLIAFIHYDYENKLHEDFLFCKHLPSHTTSAELFMIVNTVSYTHLYSKTFD